MDLTDELFISYFENKLEENEFIKKIGIYEEKFLSCLLFEMNKSYNNFNAQKLEYLIYALVLWEDRVSKEEKYQLEMFLSILNELLVSDWHNQHENIVLLLQKISSLESMDYLYKAIDLHPIYLSWDENYSFEVKCVRAIYYIGKEKSISYLDKLCRHQNDVIKNMAIRQIKKLE